MKSETNHPSNQSSPTQSVMDALAIKHILAPVDFSERSPEVLRRAAAFAGHFGARLTLLHVVEPPAPLTLDDNPLVMDEARLTKLAKRKLEVLAKSPAGGPSLEVQTLVRHGRPFQEICDAAKELQADLIIISTHGYTGLEHVLLGSTAERVVRHAPCPVMVCRATAGKAK